MCCKCPIEYYSRPFDYQISNSAYVSIFESRDPHHFKITIEDIEYDFTLETNGAKLNYKIKINKNGRLTSGSLNSMSLEDFSETYDFEKDGFNVVDNLYIKIKQSEKCEILHRLFLGKSIMIDYHNYNFIQQAATVIGIPELKEISDLTHEGCISQSNQFVFNFRKNVFYIKESCKSFFFHVWINIFSFFCFFGMFGRVLQSFWDLSGPTMIVCLFLNILILFVTMALMTLKDYLAWFFIVVIPFLLYSLYFPNIICISIIEAIERNLFFKKTFFYKHQKLISIFVKVVFDIDSFPEYFNIGKLHNFIHGILFLTFFLGFMSNFLNNKAPRFLNVWLQIFVFYIPLIRYFSLYIFYLVHSIVSLFDKPRKRFVELQELDDPFLCSFYLRERHWIDFFKASNQSKLAHKGRLIIRMVFSKTTYSILATIAVIVYMCCAETKMSGGQVCITIFIGVCIIFVLSTRIVFPFYWARRIRDHRLTEGKLEEMRENISFVANKRILRYKMSLERNKEDENDDFRESQYLKVEDDENDTDSEKNTENEENSSLTIEEKIENVDPKIKEYVLRQECLKWHIQATTWSKKYNYLRFSSIILCTLTIVFIVVLTIMAAITAVDTSNEENTNPFNYSQNSWNYYDKFNESSINDSYYNYSDYFNESFRYPQSPICFMKPKGLTMFEIVALTMLASPEPENISEDYQEIINQFLADRGEIGKDVIFVDTPFIHDKSFLSSMTLTRFRNPPKLSVFTIRGTENMQDAIADVEIWFASVVINIMMSFFPFVSLYSDRTIELIGVVTNLPRYAFKQFSLVEEYKNRFTDYIYEYVYNTNYPPPEKNSQHYKNILRKQMKPKSFTLDFHIDPDEDVMIIGHSLGGGLAKIISLVTGIQAVAVSGPGVRVIGHFYKNKTVANVGDTIIDIIPGQDLIARVDLPMGTQINVPCRRGIICHDSKRVICQMSVMCNTFERHAGWCSQFFDHETIEEMFKIGHVVSIV